MTSQEFINAIMGNVFQIVLTVITLVVTYYILPAIKSDLVPWLKEKRLYNIVKKAVMAAEKLAESGQLPKVDKKAYVEKFLISRGVVINAEVETFIEAAVKEMDGLIYTTLEEIKTSE